MQPSPPPTKRPTTSNGSPRTAIMGYAGYVPGAFSSLGTNTRLWLQDQQKIKRQPTPRGPGEASGYFEDGMHDPTGGYCGHVPGYQHSNLGRAFKEEVRRCWAETAPLLDNDRLSRSGVASDLIGTTGGTQKFATSIPPRSCRGWDPFQSTSRSDYRNFWKEGVDVFANDARNYFPEDNAPRYESRPVSANTMQFRKQLSKYWTDGRQGSQYLRTDLLMYPSQQSLRRQQQQQQSQQPMLQPTQQMPQKEEDVFLATSASSPMMMNSGSLTARPRTASSFQWIQEDSPLPRRSDVEVLTLIRSKIRNKVGSGGDLRLAFQLFTSSNMIAFEGWCRGLVTYGMNHFLRLSEAKAGFSLADANRDGLIDFLEFVTQVMGRQASGPVSENSGFLTERSLAVSKNGVRI